MLTGSEQNKDSEDPAAIELTGHLAESAPQDVIMREYESEADDADDESEEEGEVIVPIAKAAARKKKPKVLLPTSDPNIDVELRTHQKGPKRQRVVVYKEDMPQDKLTIVEKSRTLGRPAKHCKVDYSEDPLITDETITMTRPIKHREPTEKQLRQMELLHQFATLEQAAGRKLRQTAKGVVDQRCILARTPKQVAAAKAMVFRNQLKKLEKEKALVEQTAGTVRTVIGELAMAHQNKPKPAAEVVHEPVVTKCVRVKDLFRNED